MKKYLFYFVVFILGIGLGFLINKTQKLQKSDLLLDKNKLIADMSEIREGGYKFINPLLECEFEEGIIGKEFIPFKPMVQEYIDKKIAQGKISYASVYFRDLNNGPWFGINEKEKFIPASLLKVPVMMAHYKFAELDPQHLSKKVFFNKKYEFPEKVQTIVPSKEIEVGKEYTIEELIERSIIYSDNQATVLLQEQIDNSFILDVYTRLGVSTDVFQSGGTLTAKEYATFFRILFNASYLNQTFSEKALELLSQSEFTDGLVAGVPVGTIVSHKFGESGSIKMYRQIHDCGIIYYANHPYLLCIMTRGEDLGELIKSIQETSRLVWEEINKQILSMR
jgi:beta-lactamase class A